jgi:hypothetical protein
MATFLAGPEVSTFPPGIESPSQAIDDFKFDEYGLAEDGIVHGIDLPATAPAHTPTKPTTTLSVTLSSALSIWPS